MSDACVAQWLEQSIDNRMTWARIPAQSKASFFSTERFSNSLNIKLNLFFRIVLINLFIICLHLFYTSRTQNLIKKRFWSWLECNVSYVTEARVAFSHSNAQSKNPSSCCRRFTSLHFCIQLCKLPFLFYENLITLVTLSNYYL